jgi:hypothetical protein
MATCALFLGINGIGLTFLPEEIAGYLKMPLGQAPILILQILGSLYLGFAMLNWMAKNNLIGGIYSRPLVLGNLLHFLVSSFALIKITLRPEGNFGTILTLTIIYVIFAIGFGYVFLTNPAKLDK